MGIYRTYLRTVLALGRVAHAYRVADRWSYTKSRAKKRAARETSQRLVADHGYDHCPTCRYATVEVGSCRHCHEKTFFKNLKKDLQQQEAEPLPALAF